MHADRQIPGWFPEINRNHLVWIMRTHDVRVVLEVGAFLGKSTIFFAERCQKVYSVDRWNLDCLTSEDERKFAQELGLPREFRHIWYDNIKQAETYWRSSGFAQVMAFPPDSDLKISHQPELVYIDGAHQYPAVVSDIEKYGALARKIICGDDYGVAEGVTQAVDDLAIARKRKGREPVNTAGPFWWTEVRFWGSTGERDYE